MKVAAVLAVTGAIIGEFLGTDGGLGYVMLQVQVTLDSVCVAPEPFIRLHNVRKRYVALSCYGSRRQQQTTVDATVPRGRVMA